MIELFEFNVIRSGESKFSDEEITRFINFFLEPRGLFWGGGGNTNNVSGVISTNQVINVYSLLFEFVSFFKETDKIVFKLIMHAESDSHLSQLRDRQNITFESYTVNDISD
jgi:hypothetical protein